MIVDQSPASSRAAPASRSDRALKRALTAARTAEENRGRDIAILDLRELTTFFDYFVIVTGTSRRQLHAISEQIDHALEEGMGDRRLGIEGYDESRWILLDYGDVVIHVFEPETRAYYALEHLWAQAKRVPFEPGTASSPDGHRGQSDQP
jgi:ribosome-associated protein